MSMNLHCDKVELQQTPTLVTYDLFYENYEQRRPRHWTEIRDRYIEWYMSNEHAWGNFCWKRAQDHFDELMSHDHLEFYIL